MLYIGICRQEEVAEGRLWHGIHTGTHMAGIWQQHRYIHTRQREVQLCAKYTGRHRRRKEEGTEAEACSGSRQAGTGTDDVIDRTYHCGVQGR